MFGWFKKKKKRPSDNIFTALNDELERAHHLYLENARHDKNAQVFFNMVDKLQVALIKAAENHPNDQAAIKDLQDSVADLYLAGKDDE